MADCTGTLIVSLNHCTVTSDSKADVNDWLHSLEYIRSQLWTAFNSEVLLMGYSDSSLALNMSEHQMKVGTLVFYWLNVKY